MNADFIVIGGGPAGLTAAYALTRHGLCPIVLEKDHLVGGLARTESYKGYRFDMGGHRFFTKSAEVNRIWREVLGEEFLHRPRLSRIYYRGEFFDYPLKPLNALKGLGYRECVLLLLSYFRWKLFPSRVEETFEQWVTNRFGRRLFQTFFKSYTEKVWGIPCSEIRAEWAAQRIKNLSLGSAILNMIVKPRQVVTSLIDAFHYPRLGPGMMWQAMSGRIEQAGGTVMLGSEVVTIHRQGNRVTGVTVRRQGEVERLEAKHFISTMPVSAFLKKLDPPPAPELLDAAHTLKYRDFLTVCLIVDKPHVFPDNWIYVHDPQVKVGRIQNFKNWSPDMVPDTGKTALGLEYFCNEGDMLWSMPDDQLIALGRRELEQIGLLRSDDVEGGCVFRVPKAYPIYDSQYAEALGAVRNYIDSLENFQTVGRNGLHRYNNQDHSMLTGILAVSNAVLGEDNDLWSVNADADYHEELRQPESPQDGDTTLEAAGLASSTSS
jgi:protoporphyrinogen oxidase